MAQELEELPLFLLHTVLFPYAHIRLHVFEDRYKELVHDCIHEERPFGIVLIRSGDEVGQAADPYMVGTAVHIEKVDYLDDGRMDIQVHGERRFRIRRLDESRPYLTGYVEPLMEHEIENESEAENLFLAARQEFELLVQKLFARQEFNVQVVFPTDPVVLSFTIANLLSMENLDKQRLLETTDTLERVQALIPLLQNQNMNMPSTSCYPVGAAELAEWITPN
ncbi:MAG: LON peptidase substrate-binding domain-containing protein [Fimbriimonadaceae bacterium]